MKTAVVRALFFDVARFDLILQGLLRRRWTVRNRPQVPVRACGLSHPHLFPVPACRATPYYTLCVLSNPHT